LGAWSLRACCRKDVPGTEVVEAAREFLECLKAAGITTLEELKSAVDYEVDLDQPPQDVECKMLPMSRVAALRLLEYWGASGRMDRQTIEALQALHKTRSIDRLCAMLACRTADEDLVESLSTQLATQIPALAEMRKIAINSDPTCLHARDSASVEDIEDGEDDEEVDIMRASDFDWRQVDHEGSIGVEEVDSGRHSPAKVECKSDRSLRGVPLDDNRARRALAYGWKDFLDNLLSNPSALATETARQLPPLCADVVPQAVVPRVFSGRAAVSQEKETDNREHTYEQACDHSADQDYESEVGHFSEDCSDHPGAIDNRHGAKSRHVMQGTRSPVSSPAALPTPSRQAHFRHLRELPPAGPAGHANGAIMPGLKRMRSVTELLGSRDMVAAIERPFKKQNVDKRVDMSDNVVERSAAANPLASPSNTQVSSLSSVPRVSPVAKRDSPQLPALLRPRYMAHLSYLSRRSY